MPKRGAYVSQTGPCPGCHSGTIIAPEVTPELVEYSRRFYQDLLEDYVPIIAPLYHATTGEYFLSGNEASRGWGLVGTLPVIGYIRPAGRAVYLYQKVGRDGEHLKFGITVNPSTRYTSAQLGGGRLRLLTSGDKKDMLALERLLHENLPIGPEEGQQIYIWLQSQKGLKLPPYR